MKSPIDPRTVRPKDRLASRVTLTPESVAAFARAAGDHNPLHHDPEHAAGTRFGAPIASGTQTTSLLMGLVASWFSERGAMLGLDFSFRFKRAIFATETIDLEWLVVSVRPSPRLGGDLIELRGRIRNAAGETAVGAKGLVLLTLDL